MNKANKSNNNGIQHTLNMDVPAHWEIVPFEEVLEGITGGGTPTKSNPQYWEGPIPWLTVKDMRIRRPNDSIDHISEDAVSASATNVIPADTIIIATRIGLGKVIRVPYEAAINQDLKALISLPEVDKGYLEYWIVSIADYLVSIGSGTTVKGIRLEQLRSLPFPLAPLNEQNRIVAEIEKQFSRLDQAVENLNRVKANLKLYKVAVLKAAVEGKLTEQWRKTHPDVEPADKLLERILKTNNKLPAEPHKPPIDVIHESWCVVTIDQLTEYVTSGSRGWAKYYSNSGDIFVRAQNLKDDKLKLDDVAYVQLPNKVEGKRTLIQKNDILITITGANVTKTGIVNHDLNRKAYINQHIALTRPVISEISEYLFLWIICPTYGRRDLEKAAYGAGKPGLNLTNIRELVVALPPLEEQEEIITEIERRLSLADDLEKVTDKALRRADRLRQSILKKAFSGQLVPSNKEYESETSFDLPLAAEETAAYGAKR